MKPTLLWSDTVSPSMASGTVLSVPDMNDYELIIVIFSYADAVSNFSSVTFHPVSGKVAMLDVCFTDSAGLYQSTRTITLGTNQITVGQGYITTNGSRAASSYYAIPRYIYGISK